MTNEEKRQEANPKRRATIARKRQQQNIIQQQQKQVSISDNEVGSDNFHSPVDDDSRGRSDTLSKRCG